MKSLDKQFIKKQIFLIILGIITLVPFNLLFNYLITKFNFNNIDKFDSYFEIIWFSIVESVLMNVWYNLVVYFEKSEKEN